MKGAVTGLTSEAFWAANSLDLVYKSTETDFKIHKPSHALTKENHSLAIPVRNRWWTIQTRVIKKKQQPANPTATKRCYKSLENFLKKTQTFAWKKHQFQGFESIPWKISPSLVSDKASAAAIHVLKVCKNSTNPTTLAVLYPVERIRKLVLKKRTTYNLFNVIRLPICCWQSKWGNFRYANLRTNPSLRPRYRLKFSTKARCLSAWTSSQGLVSFGGPVVWNLLLGHFSTQVRHVP